MDAADPLDILFLDTWYSDRVRGSGSAVAISGLAGGLRSLGHQVTILRPRFYLPTADLTRIAANVDFRFRVPRLPAQLIVGFDLDGCFLADSSAPYAVALKGVMADELLYEGGWNRIRFRFLSRLERKNARRADRVIVTSEHSRRIATAAYELDPERVGVVPEGIDLEGWSLLAARPPRAGSPPSIVSVARQYRRKNTAVLIRAMRVVRRSISDVQLRIVGDGPELTRLRALARSLDLGDTVTFLGSVGGIHEIRSELSRADVFCLPSVQEGFGIVFLEAMAAGLPIVAANCAAVPETAPHGEVSLLVQPDDVEELAAALTRMLGDDSLRARLAAAGAVRCRRFAWREVAARFLTEVRPG